MKARYLLLTILIIIFASIVSVGEGVYALDGVYVVIYNETPLYVQADTSSNVIIKLDSGTELNVIEEVTVGVNDFYKVEYDGQTGYILSSGVYLKKNKAEHKIEYSIATRTADDAKIRLYSEPRDDSEVVKEINDGSKLDVVEQFNDRYYQVMDDGRYCYIKSENVTMGLTYYQRIAVIIGAVTLAAVAGILLIKAIPVKKK